jgi:demethylmenaquinone methyltransferase / 2-methoxy-6-polyprenyl-1,4-benzoquinol methylase
MFDRLAPRYDLFNDLLSAGVHRRWRRSAIAALAPDPGGRYLDLCAGTLDLGLAIAAAAPGTEVVGADFALAMLARGREKLSGARVRPVAADALTLPFPDATFAGCIVGFGLRNLADPVAGLVEMRRILSSGGRLVILEFTTPPGAWFRSVYHAYFHHILPRLGALVVGEREGPGYLPASVTRFPDSPSLAALMSEAGFVRVRWKLLTRGIAALHVGVVE